MEHLLEVTNMTAGYEGTAVVQGIHMSLAPKEILVIVGESGCGKSTLLQSILPVQGMHVELMQGSITFKGRDLGTLREEEKRLLRGQEISYVFQHPGQAFHPLRRIGVQVDEMLQAHAMLGLEEGREVAKSFMQSMGLQDVERIWKAYPFELSGGMVQRVAMALAVLGKPSLLLADEPTSALDASMQKQVLQEILAFRDRLGMAMILITHHMGVAKYVATTIGVMYAGRLVEYGPAKEVLEDPQHPYTKALLLAVPKLGGPMPIGLAGNPPHFKDMPTGCAFRERCAMSVPACESYDYTPYQVGEARTVLCCRRDG